MDLQASTLNDLSIVAKDGPIGVATWNWRPGKHVLGPASYVVSVRSSDREFRLDLTRQGVKNSHFWDPSAMMARSRERPHL